MSDNARPMLTRDARTDPRPGDVFRGMDSTESVEYRRVLRILSPHRLQYLSYFDEDAEDIGIIDQCYTANGWYHWARSAEIVRVSDAG